jgi:hypothetical protein
MLVGKWDEAMYYVLGDPTAKPKGYDPMMEAVLLWERDQSVPKTRFNLTPFAISLNELTPGLLDKLPPTDSRLRPDQRHLENGEYELANSEKFRLEQLQRQVKTCLSIFNQVMALAEQTKYRGVQLENVDFLLIHFHLSRDFWLSHYL